MGGGGVLVSCMAIVVSYDGGGGGGRVQCPPGIPGNMRTEDVEPTELCTITNKCNTHQVPGSTGIPGTRRALQWVRSGIYVLTAAALVSPNLRIRQLYLLTLIEHMLRYVYSTPTAQF